MCTKKNKIIYEGVGTFSSGINGVWDYWYYFTVTPVKCKKRHGLLDDKERNDPCKTREILHHKGEKDRREGGTASMRDKGCKLKINPEETLACEM